jgi:hypothetical protein
MLIQLLAQEAPPVWFWLLILVVFLIVPVVILFFTLVAVGRVVFPNYRKPPPSAQAEFEFEDDDTDVVEKYEDKPPFKVVTRTSRVIICPHCETRVLQFDGLCPACGKSITDP